MKTNFKVLTISAVAFVSVILAGCNTNNTAPVLPVEDFFKKPAKSMFRLSPNGEYVSYLAPLNGCMNMFIMDVNKRDSSAITELQNGDIQKYFWKNDSILISLNSITNKDSQNLFSININNKVSRKLLDFDIAGIKLIDKLRNNDSDIIVALNKRDKRFFDVYRLNIYTGNLVMLEKNPGNITWWYTDNNGKIRIAVTSDGVNTQLLYRKDERDSFNSIIKTNFKNFIEPLSFTDDNKNIYALTNINRDKSALVEYDLENNREVKTIFSHYEVDLEKAYLSDVSNKICGVSYTTWKKEFEFFCPDWKSYYKMISSKFQDKIVELINTDINEESILVKTFSDKSPGEYYCFNTKSDTLIKLADTCPWIDEENMADMKPISYKSSDGLTVHGYLTLPKGKAPFKLPVVVYPHEGLWERNTFEYNSEVQFLANRGYAVLQINFRGSYGYGKNFWEAGFKELGREIQNDINDGVNWLIVQNIADPKRIAIFGKSLGGYDALMGLATTPELYKCGVVFSGVLDVLDLVESIPPQYEPFREMMYEMIGNPDTEKNELEKVSPVFLTDKIKAPVLIAHGDKDQRVKQYKVDKFVAALSTMNVPVKYLIQKEEGHSFKKEKNNFKLYSEMEKFLKKNLKSRLK